MSQLGQVIASRDVPMSMPDTRVGCDRPDIKESTVTAGDKKPTVTTAEDYWLAAWKRIQQVAPKAILLRCPSHLGLERAQAWDGSTDMDILLRPEDFPLVMAVLKELGFYHVFNGQSFVERFQVRVAAHPIPCKIDLYQTEGWGLGFRIAGELQVPAGARMACLMCCLLDGKGTVKFEERQGGPPWRWKDSGMPKFGPVGRALWRAGKRKLLILYLLLKGTIRPDTKLIVRGMYRGIVHKMWRWTRKQGLEVELMGVDGAGKSTIADMLRTLPVPVKVIYMGPHDRRTWIMRFCQSHSLPRPIPQLAFRYDSLVTRLSGWFAAHRGWIVIYDRLHPFERIDPMNRTLSGRVRNAIDRIYGFRVDLTFWLTGDCTTIHRRKGEYSVLELQSHDQRYSRVLTHYRIPFDKIDVTTNDLAGVMNVIGKRVLDLYQGRTALDNLSPALRAILL